MAALSDFEISLKFFFFCFVYCRRVLDFSFFAFPCNFLSSAAMRPPYARGDAVAEILMLCFKGGA